MTTVPEPPMVEGIDDLRPIGRGGFASVYRGHQPAFRRDVAVKVLQRTGLDVEDRRRFERECQAMGALSNHPGIVTLYDAGFTADGQPYLVMDYVADGSLHDHIKARGALPWQDVTALGVRLAGALETAHRAGVLHRDIKPGNVLRSAYGAQLSDFGIARIQGGHETRSGVITASVAHAAPEILDGRPPGPVADVYALGSTMYEALAGRAAFSQESDEGLLPMIRRVITDDPPDLRGQGVPDELASVIEVAMAKDPDDRYQTAAELARALRGAQATLGLPVTDAAIVGERHADPAATAETADAAGSADPEATTPLGAAATTPLGADVAAATTIAAASTESATETAVQSTPPQVAAPPATAVQPPPVIPSGPPPGTGPPDDDSGGTRKAALIAVALIAVLVLVGGLVVLVGGDESSAPSSSAPATVGTVPQTTAETVPDTTAAPETTVTSAPETTTVPVPVPAPIVGLATPGIPGDHPILAGFERARVDFGLEITQSDPQLSAIEAIDALVAAGQDPIVAFASIPDIPALHDAVLAAALANPETTFAVIDFGVAAANVASYRFAEEEGSYLAGVAAALASQTGRVGFLGGADIARFNRYENGFAAGVLATDPTIQIETRYLPGGDAYVDRDAASALANEMYGLGADVIDHAGTDGLGLFDAAGANPSNWAIGAEIDQAAALGSPAADSILTSMVKNFDAMAYRVVSDAVAGSITPVVQNFGVADDAVGLADTGGFIAPFAGAIDATRDAIASGAVEVPT